MLDSYLNEMVKYTYNSWEKVLSATSAKGNEILEQERVRKKENI